MVCTNKTSKLAGFALAFAFLCTMTAQAQITPIDQLSIAKNSEFASAIEASTKVLRIGIIGGSGSGTIIGWTKDNQALFLTAHHNVPAKELIDGAGYALRTSIYKDPGSPQSMLSTNFATVTIPTGSDAKRFVAFPFYSPEFTGDVEKLSPGSDFAVVLITGAEIGTKEQVDAYLATNFSKPIIEPAEFATPQAGETVVAVGFPRIGTETKKAVSLGQILTNEQALQLSQIAFANSGSAVPFDPKTEVVILGEGGSGMSGGAVFNAASTLR